MTETNTKSAAYLLHLMSCGLSGAEPEIADAGILEFVYKLAGSNSIEGLTWSAARLWADRMPEDIVDSWSEKAEETLWRNLQFDVEREAIISALNKKGLSCLPIKGAVVSMYYLSPLMRSMCDNDILYGFVEPDPDGGFVVCGATEQERLCNVLAGTEACADVMLSRGYRVRDIGTGNADSFERSPAFNFEMHRVLAEPSLPWADYYSNPWKRVVQDESNPLLFHMAHEDEYVYHIVHTYKHFVLSGCGVRPIADEWVYLNSFGDSLDWDYIDEQLSVLGMEDFERSLRSLATSVVGRDACGQELSGKDGGLNQEQRKLLDYMLGSGTYGTRRSYVRNRIAEAEEAGRSHFGARARYILSRLFPSPAKLAEGYPILRKHPVLLPVVAAWRLTGRAIRSRKRIGQELDAMRGGRSD